MKIRAIIAAAAFLLPAASVHAENEKPVVIEGGWSTIQKALDEHTQRMESDPAYRHEFLGDEHSKKKDFAKAAGEYRKALPHAPKNAYLHCKLGRALVMTQKPREGLELLDKAIGMAPAGTSWLFLAWQYKGTAYAMLNEADKAIDAMTRSINLNPTEVAHLTRAGVYAGQGKFDLAIADADSAVRLAPNTAQFQVFKAQLHIMAMAKGGPDQMAEACRAMRKACELGECRPLEEFTECKAQ